MQTCRDCVILDLPVSAGTIEAVPGCRQLGFAASLLAARLCYPVMVSMVPVRGGDIERANRAPAPKGG